MKNKTNLYVGMFIIIFLLIGGFVVMRGKEKQSDATILPTAQEEAVYPTVDKSVIVTLIPNKLKTEVALTIEGVPANTTTIEYELSYEAEGNLPKGVIGTIQTEGKDIIERKGITLGTCSTGGKCVYDKGVKEISASLKFNGSYGSKLYEHNFPL